MLPENKLIGSKEAIKILGFTSAYMRKLCGDKKNTAIKEQLQAKKIGNSWVFEENNVRKFAEMRRKGKENI